MSKLRTAAAAVALMVPLAGLSSCASSDSNAKEVVLYTADGLNDGSGSYYQQIAKEFRQSTGIKVKIVEAGSGEVLQRVVQEKANPQADVLVTLPPFIQQADAQGLLQSYKPKGTASIATADKAADGTYYAMINNYLCLIRNKSKLPTAPGGLDDLLASTLKSKLQYSTPGVAGDGTAFMVLVQQLLGDKAKQYFEDLQDNNVGPSDSTGQLASKVDRGELLVANGDVQMNYAQASAMPNLDIFFPEDSSGRPTTVALPYDVGLVDNAPHQAAAKKFLDFLFRAKSQMMATTVAGGFPARTDVKPTGRKADALNHILSGVHVLHPDWAEIGSHLDQVISDYNEATGTL